MTTPQPWDGARTLLAAEQPLVWSFVGDSVTAAVWHTFGARGYPELFNERLREIGRSRDLVINGAVSARRIEDVAGDLDRTTMRFSPDVVVIGIGLNDTRGGPEHLEQFADAYRDVVSRIRSTTPAIVISQTPNGTLPTAPPHVIDHLSAYAETIRALSAELSTVLVDHHQVWTTVDEGSWFHWLGHGCHPNSYGHRAMARTLAQRLGMWDPASATGRLTIP